MDYLILLLHYFLEMDLLVEYFLYPQLHLHNLNHHLHHLNHRVLLHMDL
jgi:hypothetical protein